jgi:hypothetical protein
VEGFDVPDMLKRPVDLFGTVIYREGISARSKLGGKRHGPGTGFKVLWDVWVCKAVGVDS